MTVRFDSREVIYDFGDLEELSLAYAITIHKSQGSEFPAVVIPLATQHFMLLQRNLIYTAVTRGKRLVVLIGQRKALGGHDQSMESGSGAGLDTMARVCHPPATVSDLLCRPSYCRCACRRRVSVGRGRAIASRDIR